MEITKDQTGGQTAVIKIAVQPEDYRPKVETVLKKYQRTANIPGFRPGKIPAGMIKKMYGKPVLAEELNNLLSDALYKYIYEQKMSMLGSPLPMRSEKEQLFEDGQSFEFSYEVGLAPEFNIEVTSKDKLPYYLVKVDDKMMENEMGDLRRRFGKYTNPEVSEATHILYGDFEEMEDPNAIKAGGHKATSTIALEMIKDPIDRNQFIGLKKDSIVLFNPMKVLNNDAEVSAMLNLKDSPAVNSDYRFTVKSINNLEKAEVNEELFNKVYGEGVVKTEEEFREKIRQSIASYFEVDSDRKLQKDLKNYLLQKVEIPLPDDFLKRMLKETSQKKDISEQEFDHQYFHEAENLRWSLIRDKVAKENNLTVEEEEIKKLASASIRQQFSKYGVYDLTEDRLAELMEAHLKKDDSRDHYEKSILENKVFRNLKARVNLEVEELPYEDFVKKLAEETEHEMEHHH